MAVEIVAMVLVRSNYEFIDKERDKKKKKKTEREGESRTEGKSALLFSRVGIT
jgi:hypothetical protein